MQTFFKRLLLIIENQGFKNINDFALNGLGYDSSSKLSRLKDDKNKPSVEILIDISNKFETINLHWLITGKGEMFSEKNEAQQKNEDLGKKNESELIKMKDKIIYLLEIENERLKQENDFLRNGKSNKTGQTA